MNFEFKVGDRIKVKPAKFFQQLRQKYIEINPAVSLATSQTMKCAEELCSETTGTITAALPRNYADMFYSEPHQTLFIKLDGLDSLLSKYSRIVPGLYDNDFLFYSYEVDPDGGEVIE